LTSANPKKG